MNHNQEPQLHSKAGGIIDKTRRTAIALFVAFALVSIALIATAIAYDKGFTDQPFKSHGPISIVGDESLSDADGVTGGSGTESDPYVIEGWSIYTSADYGIVVEGTDAHLLIRNVSIVSSPEYLYDRQYGAGLVLNAVSNVKIENIAVYGFLYGVLVNGRSEAWCQDITMSQSRFASNFYQVAARNTSGLELSLLAAQPYYYDSGILLDNCTQFELRSNIVQGFGVSYQSTAAAAVSIYGSANGFVADNLIRWSNGYNAKGIWIRNSAGIVVANNSVVDAREMSIRVEKSEHIDIQNNTIEGWDNEGILVTDSSEFLVENNEFRWNWQRSDASLYATNSENGTIRNNRLIECGGIGALGSNISVSENLVDGARRWPGLYVDGKNVDVARNIVTQCSETGIEIHGDLITVADNQVTDNCGTMISWQAAGIIARGKNLTIIGNFIQNNSYGWYYPAGVLFDQSENSTFKQNILSDAMNIFYCRNIEVTENNFHGEWNFTFFETTSSTGIGFFHNSFSDAITAQDYMTPGVLLWDAGYPAGGNYWAGYTGVDLRSGPNQNQPGADGIGDTPHELSPGELDNYPLMEPASVADVTAPTTIAQLSGEVGTLGWYTSAINVTLVATDVRSNVNETVYSLDGSGLETYSTPFQVTGEGHHLLEFYSVDREGNQEAARTVDIWIDTEDPYPQSAMKTEYRFRGVDTGCVYASFEDNTSRIFYFIGDHPVQQYGFYTTAPCILVALYKDTHNYSIIAFDAAGNGYEQNISVRAVPHPNTEILSPEGPYGPWYSVAIIADIGLLIAALVAFAMNFGGPPYKPSPRDDQQKHYDEEVIDGYPKYIRKM